MNLNMAEENDQWRIRQRKDVEKRKEPAIGQKRTSALAFHHVRRDTSPNQQFLKLYHHKLNNFRPTPHSLSRLLAEVGHQMAPPISLKVSSRSMPPKLAFNEQASTEVEDSPEETNQETADQH